MIYGYWPAHSEGNSIVVGDPQEPQREIARFDFPRQKRGRHLCLADYVRPDGDVLGLQIVTMGSRIDQAAVELFEKNAYRDYLELHGLSVQLTEALAEYWHSRVRAELGIDADDASEMSGSSNRNTVVSVSRSATRPAQISVSRSHWSNCSVPSGSG